MSRSRVRRGGKAGVREQTRAIAANVDEVAAGLRAAIPAPAAASGRPALLVLMGLPGVGKSHSARRLAARLHAAHVASDHLRTQLFIAPSYTKEESAAVFGVIEGVVRRLLEEGHRVIVDATNLRRAQRSGVERIARELRVPLAHVLVTAEEGDIRDRLAARRRTRAPGDHSDADEGVYAAMRSRGFEAPPRGYLELRNAPDVEREAAQIADAVEAAWSGARVRDA